MAVFTLDEIKIATGARAVNVAPGYVAQDVSTDTRNIGEGALFVALRGERFDGHEFLEQALGAGATAVLVEEGAEIGEKPAFVVGDTRKAYQDLARFHRRKFDIPVVAITGSSGKTTTKEMVATVLEARYQVCKTEKNFNNEIGLPKTLLSLKEGDEACVIEMGMRGLGQIAELCAIAEPTLGVITNVGTSHIELLGSQSNIAQAKAELVEAIDDKGVVVLNQDDEYVKNMVSKTKAKVITYGIENSATVMGAQLHYKQDGIRFSCTCYDETDPVFLPMVGIHNVYDALAAIAVGRVLGIHVRKAAKQLAQFHGTAMRQELVKVGDIVLMNDTYNANPSSMEESIVALCQLEGIRKVALLGDMLELGSYTEEKHRQIGALLASKGYGLVYTFGEAAQWISEEARSRGVKEVKAFDSQAALINAYLEHKEPGDTVLVKGSRGLRMERVVSSIVESLAEDI